MHRGPALVILSLVTAGCGASTGLRDDDGRRDAGASVDAGPRAVIGAWERCAAGDACGGGTTCQSTTYNADGVPARLCTQMCARGAACPVMGSHSTFPVGCATDTPATGVGQCYEICETSANCGVGTRCVARAGLPFQLCLPVGAAP